MPAPAREDAISQARNVLPPPIRLRGIILCFAPPTTRPLESRSSSTTSSERSLVPEPVRSHVRLTTLTRTSFLVCLPLRGFSVLLFVPQFCDASVAIAFCFIFAFPAARHGRLLGQIMRHSYKFLRTIRHETRKTPQTQGLSLKNSSDYFSESM